MNREQSPPLELLLDQLADRIARRILQLQQNQETTPADQQSPWLNVKSAAVYLDWPPARLYKLTAQSTIPHYKQDGRLLFHRAELDSWLAQYVQPSDWINPYTRAIS